MAYDIYLSPPHVGTRELDMVREAIESNWVAPIGPHVNGFEQEMAEYIGVEEAAAVSSGTAALHLALLCHGIGAGDDVVCSSFTFIGSANPVLYTGAKPVFIDSDRSSWNMDPDLLAEFLEARAARNALPKAVIGVDLYGQCFDYDRISTLCDQYGILLIEDAAEALGADYGDRKAGTLGACSVMSFNGNKIITSSGGGMLLSDDVEMIRRARFLATQARDPAPHYQHSVTGYNYRMSNIVAAIGRAQFATIDERVAKRRQIFQRYTERLGSVPGISFMPEADYGRANRWLTCITVDPDQFGATREDIRLTLDEHKIESRPLWKPMHLQPLFEGSEMIDGSVSESLFEYGLCLPSGTAMTDEDLERVSELVLSC